MIERILAAVGGTGLNGLEEMAEEERSSGPLDSHEQKNKRYKPRFNDKAKNEQCKKAKSKRRAKNKVARKSRKK